LQGVVGRTYALAHGESLEVAQAIEESWMPRKENAPLPASPAGCLVSLADKCDNLVSCFAIGLKPTSSSDPYALRRQVVAIIKMLIERKCHLPLRETFTAIYSHFLSTTGLKHNPTLVDEILEFFGGRIRPLFETLGLLNDEITAVLALGCNDIFDRFRCATALHLFRKHSEHFPPLAEVYKRAKGLLGEGEKSSLNPALFTEKGEVALYAAFMGMEEEFKKSIVENDYAHALTLIAQLQPPLSQFFEQVKVLDADLQKRANRLALLQRLFGLFSKLFDFSALNLS
ncbi:MAG: glycine--tRNA ligase subunit beta, partial [Verrucomicrobia bacterium]|nr:glycine--tRNA ligase subunit beta [Verrucomicrobiota bacterium]